MGGRVCARVCETDKEREGGGGEGLGLGLQKGI